MPEINQLIRINKKNCLFLLLGRLMEAFGVSLLFLHFYVVLKNNCHHGLWGTLCKGMGQLGSVPVPLEHGSLKCFSPESPETPNVQNAESFSCVSRECVEKTPPA